jgi:hypothetical protein
VRTEKFERIGKPPTDQPLDFVANSSAGLFCFFELLFFLHNVCPARGADDQEAILPDAKRGSKLARAAGSGTSLDLRRKAR